MAAIQSDTLTQTMTSPLLAQDPHLAPGTLLASISEKHDAPN